MPLLDPGTTTLTDAQLRQMLAEAAEDGARRALREVGLADDDAAADVRELRSLLDAWRDAKRTAWQSVVKAATTVILIVMLAGLAVYWRGRL